MGPHGNQDWLEKRLSELKLSVAQQRILALAYFAKEPLTPSMLAALLLQETHSVSGLLNRLEDRDLITRTRERDRPAMPSVSVRTNALTPMATRSAIMKTTAPRSPTRGSRARRPG